MSEVTPTRSAVLELKDERRALHEGYVFLDEKCLLLAGEMLKELARHETLARALAEAHARAAMALRAAAARHGLEGLQVLPVDGATAARLQVSPRTLMGVPLQDAELSVASGPAGDDAGTSPESRACRAAVADLLVRAAPLAAVAGNLERLYGEYRRAVRRARALQDVLLPEADRTVAELEARLAELEQEDAIWMRQRR